MSSKTTAKSLIKDVQELNAVHPGKVTRDFYRQNGAFTESHWRKFFGTFTEFLLQAGIKSSDTSKETIEYSENQCNISLPKTRIHTLEELIEYCKIDLTIWTVDKFIANKWEMGAKNDSTGNVEIHPLFQVKAFLRKKVSVIAIRKEIEDLKTLAKETSGEPQHIERPQIVSGNMLEVNIPDAHFGKQAWGTETGYEPYDTKIAQKMYLRALSTILDRTKNFHFDEILYVVGNDLLNSDDIEGRTTKGTPVTTDGRYHKTFTKVRNTIIESIEQLRRIAPVKVLMIPGNHDTLSVWHLGDSLECYFNKYSDVSIDNVPTYRKYHRFGNVMLMFTHGDKAKRTDYPLLMAAEQPAMWGNTLYRECHTGHNHMTKLDEQHGVRVRILPALCPPDDWHSENGFVGNLRNAEGYVWNQREGLITTVTYCDNAQEPIRTKRQII